VSWIKRNASKWHGRERPVTAVPVGLRWGFALALCAQLTLHALSPRPVAEMRTLAPAPSVAHAQVASLGQPVAAAKTLNLWLQAHDYQPGISIPYSALDYQVVRGWLELILALDPRGQYPLLAASRLYALLPDPARQRLMLDFVHEQFANDPERRWRWLAHAALVAKYQLQDLQLALKYARSITAQPHAANIPFWARDLSVLILQDLCEFDAARVLVGGLLADGQLQDRNEQQFLHRKLDELANAQCQPIDLRARILDPRRQPE